MASTGVIGVRLPMDKLRAGIAKAARGLTREGGAAAARAILTTDTRPKEVAVAFEVAGQRCLVGGMAKGAGMIAPNMATMLAFFTSDAAVEPALLRRALVQAAGASLNRITVDGDTSTNDCAIVLASGASGAPAIEREDVSFEAFQGALTDAAAQLAEMLVRDGEGVTKVARVVVEGARTTADADRIVRTISESPLVKTALHGGDPNWGRILACVGRAGVAARHRPRLGLDRRPARSRERRRARVRRARGGRRDAGGPGSPARAARRGRGFELDVDLGLLARLRGHQRALPDVSLRFLAWPGARA